MHASLSLLCATLLLLSGEALATGKPQGVQVDYRSDYDIPSSVLQPLAERGDAVAEYRIGLKYDYGLGMPQDYALAMDWYRKSAAQGNAKAENHLGMLYFLGHGVPKDYGRAVASVRKAASLGDIEAGYNLAVMYDTGEGVARDYSQAIALYRKAAAGGFTLALSRLGRMYQLGHGVPKDLVTDYALLGLALAHGSETADYDQTVLRQQGLRTLDGKAADALTLEQVRQAQGLTEEMQVSGVLEALDAHAGIHSPVAILPGPPDTGRVRSPAGPSAGAPLSADDENKLLVQADEMLKTWGGREPILDQAHQRIAQVLGSDPDNALAHVEMADYLLRKQRLDASPDCIPCLGPDRAVKFRPVDVELKTAFRLDPKSAAAFLVSGESLRAQLRYPVALDAFSMAGKLGAGKSRVDLEIARTYVWQKRWTQAESSLHGADVELAKEAHPAIDVAVGLSNEWIEIYRHQRNLPAMRDRFEKMLALEPASASTYHAYAQYLIYDMGDADAAMVQAKKAVALGYRPAEITLAVAQYAKWAAARKSDPRSAAILLQQARQTSPDVERVMTDAAGFSGGNPTLQNLVAALMAQGTPVDAQDASGYTGLILASCCDHRESVRWLLDKGASTKVRNYDGDTALTLAVEAGNMDIVELLVAHGADVNAAGSGGRAPLLRAMMNGDGPMVRKLIALKADINGRAKDEAFTPLMSAAVQGSAEFVRILLAAGADPFIRMKDGSKNANAAELADLNHHPQVAAMIRVAMKAVPARMAADPGPMHALPPGQMYVTGPSGPVIVSTKPEPPNTLRVWVVSSSQSKVYYCPASPSFGRASPGEFMSEAMARVNGYQPDGGRACGASKH